MPRILPADAKRQDRIVRITLRSSIASTSRPSTQVQVAINNVSACLRQLCTRKRGKLGPEGRRRSSCKVSRGTAVKHADVCGGQPSPKGSLFYGTGRAVPVFLTCRHARKLRKRRRVVVGLLVGYTIAWRLSGTRQLAVLNGSSKTVMSAHAIKGTFFVNMRGVSESVVMT